jgi:hypothetical protein
VFFLYIYTKNQFHSPLPHRSQVFPATYTVNDTDANTALLKPSAFTVATVSKFTIMRIDFLLIKTTTEFARQGNMHYCIGSDKSEY